VRLISLEHCPTGGDPEHVFLFFCVGYRREGGEREREREREKERDRERVDGCGFPVLGWETGAEFLNWGHLPLSEFRNFAGPGRGESGPGVGSGGRKKMTNNRAKSVRGDESRFRVLGWERCANRCQGTSRDSECWVRRGVRSS